LEFFDDYPGRRSRCSLALGYFLSALQSFNLRKFGKFVSKNFLVVRG